jgi:hypothetical protein
VITWLSRRRARHEQQVLFACRPDGSTAYELAKQLRRPVLGVVIDLERLERRGELRAWWVEGPYPRKRRYAPAVNKVVTIEALTAHRAATQVDRQFTEQHVGPVGAEVLADPLKGAPWRR